MRILSLLFLLLSPSAIPAQSLPAPLTSPTSIPCPKDVPLVRSAGAPGNQSLSSAESTYISQRATSVLPNAWKTYLQNVNSTSPTPLPQYVSDILTGSSSAAFPKLGIALSGGGYRAALFGAGVLSSLDARNTTAAQKVGTGGLLQAASYLASLSGGSWLVTALAQANFPAIPDLVFPPDQQVNTSASGAPSSAYGGFNAQVDLINPGPGVDGTTKYFGTLFAEVQAKGAAGFPVPITDIWSRALSRHFVNGTTPQDVLSPGVHGAGVLFSDIASQPSFESCAPPFPIVVADSFSPRPNTSEVLPGALIPLTNEIWEFNMYETGSYDPMLSSFIPTKLLGSTNSSNCVAGFEQAAYITGISSNLYPSFNITEAGLQSSPAGPIIATINSLFPNQDVRLDSAAIPNPFQGINPSTFANSNETIVSLVDGGLDGQVLPFQPMLVQARGVDTIMAVDASADDVNNFANGTAIIASAKRASLFGKTYAFPPVPSTPTIFVQQNLTLRPTFFGCNDSSGTPLIIYIANGGPPASGAAPVTNTTTAQATYAPEEVRAFLDQTFEISTQGAPVGTNRTDAEWGACLACAVVDRARSRSGARRDGVCNVCFQRYCWPGNATSASKQGGGRSNAAVAAKPVLACALFAIVLFCVTVLGV